jgi:hypothetical protein
MVKHRSIVPAPGVRPRLLPRRDVFSRLELETLHQALLVRLAATSETDASLQLATLVTICSLLLDDQAALSAAERADYQRELLLDVADLGIHLTH